MAATGTSPDSGACPETDSAEAQFARATAADHDKATFYRPTAKQIEFHTAGATARKKLNELLAAGGRYEELYRTQFAEVGDELPA